MLKWLLPVLCLLSLLCGVAHTEEITLVPGDGCNLTIRERVSSTHLIAGLSVPAHNWFAGTLSHLPTTEAVTIDLPMTGNDGGINKGDVRKWVGLRPMMTYADPSRYESYETFTRTAQGRWVSNDPFQSGEAKDAGIGKVPRQTAIPAEVAEQFLSADGNSWYPWREMDAVEADVGTNTFRMQQRFTLSTATIALHVPFTDTYLQAFLTRLKARKLPCITVDVAVTTPGQRALSIIRIDDPTPPDKDVFYPTVLVIAGEHATEHASSWALFGLLSRLASTPLTSPLRKGRTWLFLPIEDPEGRAQSNFERIIESFCFPRSQYPEVLAYTHYLTDFAFPTGRPIDIVVDLHNVEANEGEHLFCPIANIGHVDMVRDFNRSFFHRLTEQGYQAGDAEHLPDIQRPMRARLYGWCVEATASFDLIYEVNDRYPPRRLALAELQGLGISLGDALVAWCDSPQGKAWHQHACQVMAKRLKDREQYFQERNRDPAMRLPFDTVVQGY